MNKHQGESSSSAPRPRRKVAMLDRALNYAKLYNHGKGKSVTEIAAKVGENEVTVYKLIRMGNAPRSIVSLIEKDRIPATVVLNLLKASMSDKEMIDAVNDEVSKREEAIKQLHKEGFQGGTSMTVKRAIALAVANLKQRRMIKSDKQKAVVDVLNAILGNDKPAVADIEKAILTA